MVNTDPTLDYNDSESSLDVGGYCSNEEENWHLSTTDAPTSAHPLTSLINKTGGNTFLVITASTVQQAQDSGNNSKASSSIRLSHQSSGVFRQSGKSTIPFTVRTDDPEQHMKHLHSPALVILLAHQLTLMSPKRGCSDLVELMEMELF